MFSRLVRLRSLAFDNGLHKSVNFSGFPRRFKSNGWVDGGDHATLNDLPIPQGDWREYHSRRNMRNNIVFVTGVAAFAASFYLLFLSGTVTFNATRPVHWKDDDHAPSPENCSNE